MGSKQVTVKKKLVVEYYAGAVFSAENINQHDTIPLDMFDSAVNLKKAVVMNDNDGTEVTCSVSLNVITITGAGTALRVTIFAYGRLA